MVQNEIPRAKIEGGFVLVPVADLMSAWHACRSRPLGTGDFRAWLATQEVVARRGHLDEGREPTYRFAEMARLLGVTERRARASIRRLVGAGLIQWSDTAIEFPDQLLEDEELPEDSIGGGRGRLAIPRRMLRFLARGARPALIATALGTLLRCLSRRRVGFEGRGRIKSSWVAEAFGVSLRQVKSARLELVAIGWLESEPAAQWTEQRWGRAFRIRLDWSPAARSDGARLTPPTAESGARLTPPDLQTRIPSGRNENQEPPSGRSAGAGVQSKGEGDKPLPAPTFDDVRPEDLVDTARTLKLHAQAVARGLVGPSEADRLKFLALAEHVVVFGARSPGALFTSLVHRRAWTFATQGEEDYARRRLRDYLAPPPHSPGRPAPHPIATPSRPTTPPPRISTFVPNAPQPAGPTALADILSRFSRP